MSDKFLKALEVHQEEFGLIVPDSACEKLLRFYELLLSRNELLHLVAPCDPEEFAVRHVLESLFISKMLENKSMIADIGSGGGLPGIPLAIFRKDLTAVLVESKEKKARFLAEASKIFGLAGRVSVVNKQFEETTLPSRAIVIVRALDKFTQRIERLVKWSGPRRMLLFAGPSVEERLREMKIVYKRTLIPMSEQRFVLDIKGRSRGPRAGSGRKI